MNLIFMINGSLITDSQFLHFLQDQRIVEIIEHVFSEEAVGVQTMFYIKPPRSTGHSWHQDQYYIPGAPKPIAAVWCALDSTDETNGALAVYPGSHKYGLQEMVALDSPDFANHSNNHRARLPLQPSICLHGTG